MPSSDHTVNHQLVFQGFMFGFFHISQLRGMRVTCIFKNDLVLGQKLAWIQSKL